MPAHSAPAATEPSDLWAIVGTGWIWGSEMYPTLQCVGILDFYGWEISGLTQSPISQETCCCYLDSVCRVPLSTLNYHEDSLESQHLSFGSSDCEILDKPSHPSVTQFPHPLKQAKTKTT